MCKVLEEMCHETALAAAELRSVEIAKRLIAKGTMPLEEIAEVSDLSIEKVRELSEQKSA